MLPPIINTVSLSSRSNRRFLYIVTLRSLYITGYTACFGKDINKLSKDILLSFWYINQWFDWNIESVCKCRYTMYPTKIRTNCSETGVTSRLYVVIKSLETIFGNFFVILILRQDLFWLLLVVEVRCDLLYIFKVIIPRRSVQNYINTSQGNVLQYPSSVPNIGSE